MRFLARIPRWRRSSSFLVRRGNPFFLEETVRTLVETKALEGSASNYRLTRPVEAIQVPATVQVMLAARIDRLSSEDKRLLQVAAVVGRHVPFSLLRAVAELPDEALRGALDRLQAGRVRLRDGPVSGPRIQLQARADAGGRLRQHTAGASPRASCSDRRSHRETLSQSARRAGRIARPPRRARRIAREGGVVSVPERGQRRPALGAAQRRRACTSRHWLCWRRCRTADTSWSRRLNCASSCAAC